MNSLSIVLAGLVTESVIGLASVTLWMFLGLSRGYWALARRYWFQLPVLIFCLCLLLEMRSWPSVHGHELMIGLAAAAMPWLCFPLILEWRFLSACCRWGIKTPFGTTITPLRRYAFGMIYIAAASGLLLILFLRLIQTVTAFEQLIDLDA